MVHHATEESNDQQAFGPKLPQVYYFPYKVYQRLEGDWSRLSIAITRWLSDQL